MPTTIAAVKYACDGEVTEPFEIAPHTVYNLQPSAPIFQSGELSELSVLIGMPLVIDKLRPSLLEVYHNIELGPGGRRPMYVPPPEHKPKKKETTTRQTAYASYDSKPNANYFPNSTAAMLMVVCSDNKSTPLFCPPTEWILKVGSVLIARQDKVPLHPVHIEILQLFITAVHDHLIERSQGQRLTAQTIADNVTPELWRAYWHMVVEHWIKIGHGPKLAGVPTPFEDTPAKTAEAHGGEADVQLGGDSDMMDCEDVGFTQ